jgi:hypothetical protein
MKKTMFLAAAVAALALPAAAFAHAHVSPSVVVKGHSEVFTLAVPTEKDGATTTSIELTPPTGFNIDSFVPSPGWKRTVQQSGSGEDAVVTKVTWTGGSVPTGVVHIRGRRTLGDLFRVWGRLLGPRRLLSFAGRVSVFVGGRPFAGDPRRVPLTRHAQIVVEVGGHVAPHPSYLFPKGVG